MTKTTASSASTHRDDTAKPTASTAGAEDESPQDADKSTGKSAATTRVAGRAKPTKKPTAKKR